MRILSAIVVALAVAGPLTARAVVFAQSPGQFEVGSRITIQGCVHEAGEPRAYVMNQIMEWPVPVQGEGKYGRRSYWTSNSDQLEGFVGDTLQLSGEIVSVKKSEIELEPGMRKFGALVEFERPDHNVLATPEVAGVDVSQRGRREDVPITLLELKVDQVIRVLHGCLPTTGQLN